MARVVLLILAATLVGCSSAGQKAEDQYRMVENSNPTQQDLCDAGRKVADTYLQAGDRIRYADWKNKSDIDCLNARMGSTLSTS